MRSSRFGRCSTRTPKLRSLLHMSIGIGKLGQFYELLTTAYTSKAKWIIAGLGSSSSLAAAQENRSIHLEEKRCKCDIYKLENRRMHLYDVALVKT